MVFTFTHGSVNLSATTNISVISNTSPFSLVTAEGSGNAITVSFSGTYPNQAVGGNINYSFGVNVTTSYVSANDAYFIAQNSGYTVSPTYINTGFGATGATFGSGNTSAFGIGGNTITITSVSGYKFSGVPTISHDNGNGSSIGNIYITGQHSTATFDIPAPALSSGDTVLTLLPTSTIQANAPDGLRSYVNMYLSTETNTGGTPRVTAISVNGVTISSDQSYVSTGLSIDGRLNETTDVAITIQKDNTTSTEVSVALNSSNVRNNDVAAVTSSPLTGTGNETFTIRFTGKGTRTVSGNSYSTTIGTTEINLTANPNSQGNVVFGIISFTNASS